MVQHGKTPDRLLYSGVVVNAGEKEVNGNPNQMPSTLTLIWISFKNLNKKLIGFGIYVQN